MFVGHHISVRMKSDAKNMQCFRLIFSEYEEPWYDSRFYQDEESKRHNIILLPLGLHLKFPNLQTAKVEVKELSVPLILTGFVQLLVHVWNTSPVRTTCKCMHLHTHINRCYE